MRVAAWRCQSPGPRALLERSCIEEAGEHPRPVLGGRGLSERPSRACEAGRGGWKGACGGRPCQRRGWEVSLMVNFPKMLVCEWSILVRLGAGEAFRGAGGVVRPPPQPSSGPGSSPAAGPPGRVFGSFARSSCSDPFLTEKGQMRAGGGGQTLAPGPPGLREPCSGRGDGVQGA